MTVVNRDGSLSRALADAVIGWRWADMPAPVQRQTLRSLVNFFACALAGYRDPAVTTAARVFARLGPAGHCTRIGSGVATNALHAASLNAMAANVFDFDDTHMPTIAHPTAPVAPAALALSQMRRISGIELLEAVAAGIELECRIALAMSPGHYSRGWHITSTCGVFGAAAAAARLVGLDSQQTVWAFGSAAVQGAGLVEMLGTMSKSLSVGNAAANGMLSVWLAEAGFAGPPAPLDGERGFVPVFGPTVNWPALAEGLGERWEILANTFKPYPCGVVLNPVIEACLTLRPSVAERLEQVSRIELRAHPLLRQRTDRPGVNSGKLSQVSAQHAVAASLSRGRAGLDEFSDAAVSDPRLKAFERMLRFVDDESLGVEAAEVTLLMADGARLSHRVDAAHGSLASPLTDDELSAKCRELVRYGESGVDAEALLDALWRLEEAPDASVLLTLAAGRHGSV